MEELVGLIALITFLLSLFLLLFVAGLFQLIANKKIHDFYDTLDEHDKSIIVSYKKASTLNIRDFKRKKEHSQDNTHNG